MNKAIAYKVIQQWHDGIVPQGGFAKVAEARIIIRNNEKGNQNRRLTAK